MKKYIALFILSLLLMGILAAKPVFNIKLINSFKVTGPVFDPSFTEYCVTDSMIIVLDTADSTRTKTFCYDYQGNRVGGFILSGPAGFNNRQPFCFRYLYGRKQIAMEGLIDSSGQYGMNFYSLQGKLLKSQESLDDHTLFSPDGIYSDVVEYDHSLYYKYWRTLEASLGYNEVTTTSMTWYSDRDDSLRLRPLRKVNFEQVFKPEQQNPTGIFQWGFLQDVNRDKLLTMVEETKDSYILRYFNGKGLKKSIIKRHQADHLHQLFAGENYIILSTITNGWKPSPAAGLYDLKGHKIMSMNKLTELFYKQKDEAGIIDIVGNLMIMSNKDNVI